MVARTFITAQTDVDEDKWQKLCEFLGYWTAERIALKEDAKLHYVQFIMDCGKRVNSEEVLIEIIYDELCYHANWQLGLTPEKKEIREKIHKFLQSLGASSVEKNNMS